MQTAKLEDRHDGLQAQLPPAIGVGLAGQLAGEILDLTAVEGPWSLLASVLPLRVDFTAMFTVGIGIAFSIGRFVHLNR